MQTHQVEVRQRVRVSVDESKFTPEFMAEFRSFMFPFDTVAEHVEHLARLYVRGLYDEDSFIEGYGPAREFGIKFQLLDGSEEIIPNEQVAA